MKIGTIILCRYTSSRLPGKILKEIEGKKVLQYLYEKLATVVPKDTILVATSDDSSDDIIENYCNVNDIKCYRGDLHNVALRFLNAAKHAGFDYVTRINGDAIFVDMGTYKEMIEICRTGNYDFISNVKGRSFPFGMSVEIVKTSFFEEIQKKIQIEEKYKEHVTLFLYDHPDEGKQYHHYNTKCPELEGLHIAIDELKDFQFASKIMSKLKDDYYTIDLQGFHKVIQNIENV